MSVYNTETPSLRLPNTKDENFHGQFKKKIVGITRDGIIVPLRNIYSWSWECGMPTFTCVQVGFRNL
jgi:hypothetical protein